MDKQGMTNVDVAALAVELDALVRGGRFDKAFQPAKDRVLVRLRRKGHGRIDLLFELGRFVTATRRPPENPDRPSMVAKILRDTFDNARITSVRQVGFDRVLRLDFERGDGRRSIVLEVFGDGNLLILDADDDDRILLPMRGADHGARKLRKGEVYVPPPGAALPFDLDLAGLRAAGADARRDIVRMLALDLGFGPLWAEELCLRAEVDKASKPAALDATQWTVLHAVLVALGNEIQRNDLAPALVFADRDLVDAVPLPMQTYADARHALEEASSFAEALDGFFVGRTDEEADDDPRQPRFDEARGKLQRQLQQMQAKMDEFVADEAERRADGEALYLSFPAVEARLNTLRAARERRSWQDVAAILQQARDAGDAEAGKVLELRPDTGEAVFLVAGEDGQERPVRIDLYKSVQENADVQFAAAKKAKSRQQGAAKALEDAKQRLADLDAKGLDAFGAAPKKADRQSRHFWFEAYRWTITPSGLVAVGGRNAGQNDAVVKKYLRDGDRYCHAAIHGAPSVVLRPADGPPVEPTEADLEAACAFAACSSRAWRQFAAASAYWVTPAQVDKRAASGEFVPKGAWMVHGKRNTLGNLPMQWAIGRVTFLLDGTPLAPGTDTERRTVAKIVGGPPSGVLAFDPDALQLAPGDEDSNDVAMELAEQWAVDVEEVQRAMPPGGVIRG